MAASDQDEKSVFLAAIEIASSTDRVAYLDRACANNSQLRAAVEALLASHQNSQGLLDATSASSAERPAAQIGPYKLIEQIGEGGMGTVWMAQQSEPVKRLVAIKLIKAGMNSRQVIARFEAERQALALMDHANIARVLDGGRTSAGRPYFVMDLVRGVPITQYCDEHHLTPRQRLELFIPVCQAIQHAHQKGIIHRDLKPSNVLVALYDDQPVPKVIDFGVAKATGQQLTERTLHTAFGTVVGTLEYMSPEQATFNQLDVDTRSDVYSLGILLYELLAGSPPFTRKELERVGMLEMLRVIREEEPSKPSIRLSSSDALPTLSANRGTEPAKLTRLVRGELDWIVMKALEKDRSRRYETANGFAHDVQRYLNDEAVHACPPSAGYRLRKFARRNKRVLATACVFGVALLLVVGTMGWTIRDRSARQARVASQVELILDDVERLETEQKWPEALATAKRAEAVIAGGEADAATQQRLRQVLADVKMVERLDEIRLVSSVSGFDFKGEERAYGDAFRDYGIDVLALPEAQAGTRLRSRTAIAVPLAVALDCWANRMMSSPDDTSWRKLVAVAKIVDPDPLRNRLRERWLQVVTEQDRTELTSLADPAQLRNHPSATVLLLAQTLEKDGLRGKAVSTLRFAQDNHPGDFWINVNLAFLLSQDPQERVRFYSAALALRPGNTGVLNNLGMALRDVKRVDEAIACYRKAVELNPKHVFAHINLGVALLYDQNKRDEGIACFKRAIEIDPKYAGAHNNLGLALKAQGKLDEAIAEYRIAIELDPKNAEAYVNLGPALHDQKKLDEAVAACRQAVELDPNLAGAHLNLGKAVKAQGKLDEAIAEFRMAIELDPKFVMAYSNLGWALCDDPRDYEKAAAAFRKAIEIDPNYANAHNGLGRALHEQGKLEEAIASHRKAIELDPKDAMAHNNLGWALQAQGTLDKAIACYRKAIELDPKNAYAPGNLGNVLMKMGWDLANQPDPKLRDPKRAVELATEAIGLAPQASWAWQKLGWIQYRAGNWTASIEALEKSCKLQNGGTGDCGRWFVLALAHAKLAAQEGLPSKEREDHQAEARRRYEAADKQIDSWWRVRPGHNSGPAIWDFRTEAAALLGLPNPEQASALFEQAQTLRDQKKLAESETVLREVIQLKPENVQAYDALGWLLSEQQKLAEAEAAFRDLLRLDPDHAGGHHGLGMALLRQKKSSEAVASLREAIRLGKTDHWVYEGLGWALVEQGQFAEAETAFRDAVRLKRDFVNGHSGLGRALAEQKKFADAEAAFRDAVRLKPDDAGGHRGLGWALLSQEKFAAAEAAFRDAVRLKRDDAGGHQGLGIALTRQKKPSEAIASLREAIRLGPTNPWVYDNLGWALVEQGEFAEAEAAFREAVRLKPDLVNSHSGLGRALAEQKRFTDAEAAFREVVRLKPKLVSGGYAGLGRVLVDQKKFAEAEEVLRKALDLEPTHPGASELLGRALVGQGKFAEAEELKKKSEPKPSQKKEQPE